ncbi:MAG TPA: hypothetical protein VG318_12455 [Actinomycetota bacterium]|nr:hypothetical protein [Actinomycetota bacterium]
MRATVAAAACLILLSGCAQDRDAQAPRPTPAAEPEFVNGGECPASRHDELPPDAGCVSSVTEAGERLLVYALVDAEDKPRSWWMRFSSGGDSVGQRLRAGHVTSYPRAVGVTDLDDDGRREWWVKVVDYASHGAPWAGLNVFLFEGDGLSPVTYEGRPLAVDFGGISRLGEGAACRGGDLVVLRVWALDRQNTRWRVSERTYDLEGTRARLVDREQRLLVVDSYTDPDLVRNYRVQCDGSTFTPFG